MAQEFFQRDPVMAKNVEDSSFHAFRSLMEAENNLKIAQNRVKVLMLNEQRNRHKINQQMHVIEKITEVRDKHRQEVEKIQLNSRKEEEEKQRKKQANQEKRNGHKSRLASIHEEIAKERYESYVSVEKKSQQAMESIDNLKKSMLRDRTEQRARINDSENKIRESIIQFHDNKSRCIQHANQAEIERITAKKNKKELQLRDVTNLQTDLLRKHMESQAAYLEIKQRLDLLMRNTRTEHTSKHKLQLLKKKN